MDRFAGHRSALPSLDLLASSAVANQPLETRLQWLVDLVRWIRRPGNADDNPETQIPAGRLKRFFNVLDRNPDWKKQVAQTLRSIVRETSAVDLFGATGLPRQFGLISEMIERTGKKLLPAPPESAELGILFDRVFSHRHDADWIEQLDEPTLERLAELLSFEVSDDEKNWNSLSDDVENALFYLAAQLHISGSAWAIRSRIKAQNVRELPFFRLGTALRAVMAAKENHDAETLASDLNYLRTQIEACHRAADDALGHLEHRGVSTEVVYQLAFVEASLRRFESLLEMAFNPYRSMTAIRDFVALMVRENRARESLRDLIKQNFRLMTRKLVERNAETGEHYIARTPKQYGEMLLRAAGGGVIMAFTTWGKIILLSWHLAALWQGLVASLNYSLGFVGIQLTGSTLATKQPANTAPALAARMHRVRDSDALNALVDEIVLLIRSQFASVVGNLLLVAPTAWAISFAVAWARGNPLYSPQKAAETIHSLSIFGPTPIYAAITGVLLWASSLIAAWADNWFVFHHIGKAVESDRRLMRLLGPSRTQRLSRFWERNIAGFAGNVSFGFMLGIIPELTMFAGLPFEVRHVTLSSSVLAISTESAGASVMKTFPFWMAVIGTLSAGVINVGVSFSMAMWVAIRARGIQAPERRAIYSAIIKRAVEEPLSFVLPVGGSGAVKIPQNPAPELQ
jgi:site-specific recombinase